MIGVVRGEGGGQRGCEGSNFKIGNWKLGGKNNVDRIIPFHAKRRDGYGISLAVAEYIEMKERK